MIDFISVTSADGKSYTIFTGHIAYIEPSAYGSTIHISCGQQTIHLETKLKREDLLKLIKPDT